MGTGLTVNKFVVLALSGFREKVSNKRTRADNVERGWLLYLRCHNALPLRNKIALGTRAILKATVPLVSFEP